MQPRKLDRPGSMTPDRYPRVLIVGQIFESMTGGGITLTQLFKGWPSDRIAVLTGSASLPRNEVCGNYYRIGSAEIGWIWPLSYVRRRADDKSGAVQVEIGSPPEASPAWKLRTESGIRGRVQSLLRWLGIRELFLRYHSSPLLRDWLRAFRPDIVYTQLSDLNIMRLVGEVLEEVPVPLVLHFMDDWPATMYRRGVFSAVVRSTANRHLVRLIQAAAVCMGISELMCKAYSERYRKEFHPFQNTLEWASWEPRARREWSAGSPFIVLYRGRIGAAASHGVKDVADAVRSLYSSGKNVQFAVFTPDRLEAAKLGLVEEAPVTMLSAVPYAELPAALSSADVLALPLDFDLRSAAFARYSMPTKVPEYMASGVPVLVYAPPGHAVSLYAKEKGWGYVVSRRSIQELQGAILRLMDDEALRASLGNTAKALAHDNHDARLVRERFRQLLARASGE